MTATTTNQEVARTILSQIGGMRRVATMTGAKDFVAHADGVSFRLPTRKGPNHVRVVLDVDDTYTVTFGRIRGVAFKVLETVPGVYCDGLKSTLERHTGLFFSL